MKLSPEQLKLIQEQAELIDKLAKSFMVSKGASSDNSSSGLYPINGKLYQVFVTWSEYVPEPVVPSPVQLVDKTFEDREIHLSGLSSEGLRDIARNEAAPMKWRIAAMEHLFDQYSFYCSDPELVRLADIVRNSAEQIAKSEAVDKVKIPL